MKNAPQISLTVTGESKDSVSQIAVQIDMKKYFKLALTVDLALDTTTAKQTVSFSGYNGKLLELGLNGSLPLKNVQDVSVKAYVNGNLAAGQNLGTGLITYNPTSAGGGTPHYAPGYFDGTSFVFQLKGLIEAMNATSSTTPAYSAAFNSGNAVHFAHKVSLYDKKDAEYNAGTSKFTNYKSIYKMINDAAKEANVDIRKPANSSGGSSGEGKGLNAILWEFFTDATATGDIADKEVLKQGDIWLKKHVSLAAKGDANDPGAGLVIYDGTKDDEYNSYSKLGSRVVDAWNLAKDWIIGSEANHNATPKTYGILYWTDGDTTRKGGITLNKAGKENDLLDAVNFFIRRAVDSTQTVVNKKFDELFFETKDNENNMFVAKSLGLFTKTGTAPNEVYTSTLASTIGNGAYIGVSNVKNQGLTGALEVRDSKEGTTVYAHLDGSAKIIAFDAAKVTTFATAHFTDVSVANQGGVDAINELMLYTRTVTGTAPNEVVTFEWLKTNADVIYKPEIKEKGTNGQPGYVAPVASNGYLLSLRDAFLAK
jgi:hypothetical protein